MPIAQGLHADGNHRVEIVAESVRSILHFIVETVLTIVSRSSMVSRFEKLKEFTMYWSMVCRLSMPVKLQKGIFQERLYSLNTGNNKYREILTGRDGEIRTHDPRLPKTVLYQAELHPEVKIVIQLPIQSKH
jgi:hypothetical protein